MKEFIEKLIERLEEESRKAVEEMVKAKSNAGENYCSGMAGAFNKTVKIVNQLAEEYNNDFCEWTEYDYKTIRSPHERDWSIPSMKDFKFCPYCGKKIKIAPYQPKGE